MKVSMVTNNVQNNNSNVHFNGIIQGLNRAIVVQDGKISPKSKNLIHALDDLIERSWTAIKKGELRQTSPFYTFNTKKGAGEIRPVYTQKYPAVLFELDDGKYIEKILISRKQPSDFVYEKIVPTQYGSATLKHYNSQTQNDYDLNNRVNEVLESSIPNVLPRKVYLEHFDTEAYKHYHSSL